MADEGEDEYDFDETGAEAKVEKPKLKVGFSGAVEPIIVSLEPWITKVAKSIIKYGDNKEVRHCKIDHDKIIKQKEAMKIFWQHQKNLTFNETTGKKQNALQFKQICVESRIAEEGRHP